MRFTQGDLGYTRSALTRALALAHETRDMNFQISVTGLPAGTTVTDAHIHNGAAGVNAGVYVATTLTSGELVITNGSGTTTKNGISVPADKAAAILANPAGHYFNVHTALNPNGAMRGQLSTPA